MVCCNDPENINNKMDDAIQQVPKFKYRGSIITEDGKSKGDMIQRVTEAKGIFNDKNQLLCSNNLSLVIKKERIKFVFAVLLFMDQKYGP